MKPAPFDYARPEALEEALDLLQQNGDDARVLAGGQSLMPMMNFRLAQPELLIDINRISDLSGIASDGAVVSIGATTRYAEIGRDALISSGAPLIRRAMPLVAHPTIRNRGTIGGSLANADPSAELPACAVCLDATIVLRSAERGERLVPAHAFFEGTYSTAALPDEIITEIRIAHPAPGERCSIMEIAPRHGDFSLAGLAARAILREGRLFDVALVFFSVVDMPVVAESAQQCLEGALIDDAQALEAAAGTLGETIDFREDQQLGRRHRERLAVTLLKRVINDIVGKDA